MMTYKINEKRKLLITDEVIQCIYNISHSSDQNESGGILIGKVSKDLSTIIITDITTPTTADRRGRFFFIRNKEAAQKVINTEWKRSLGVKNYLGEWHTHPERYPTPSPKDLELIDDCKKKNSNPFEFIFMIIAGNSIDIYVGYQERNTENIQKLVSVEENNNICMLIQ